MRTLIRITITALLISGTISFGNKKPLYYRMAKVMFLKINEGLPSLRPFTEKLTGKKFTY